MTKQDKSMEEDQKKNLEDSDEECRVGKSELVMETELIQLMEKAHQLEKDELYMEAIEVLEQALKITDFQEGLKKKILEVRAKMEKEGGAAILDDDFDLEGELDALSEEAKQEMPPPSGPATDSQKGSSS